MANHPEPPPRPVSARVTVPVDMIYSGQLPIEPPERPSPLSDSAWRNIAVTLATVLVLGAAGAYIFWPKSDVGTPVAVESIPASTTAGPTVTASGPAPGPSGSTAAAHTGTAPSGVGMPTGNIAGWRQTFAEDFNGGNLADKWFIYSGQPGGDPGGWFLPTHVNQSGGKLVITGSKESTPNGNIYATGGISNSKTFTQTYGKFEYRFRMDKGYGINYVMMLWPSDDSWPPEINVAEDDGKTRNLITATLHYGANNSTITKKSPGAADFTKWHTVGVEWKPGSLTYQLDGKTWATMTSTNVPKTPMSVAIQSQAWPCGNSFSDCPNSTTPAKVNLEIDWIVAYTAT
jgi:beta-glucanase (GH16 family)